MYIYIYIYIHMYININIHSVHPCLSAREVEQGGLTGTQFLERMLLGKREVTFFRRGWGVGGEILKSLIFMTKKSL